MSRLRASDAELRALRAYRSKITTSAVVVCTLMAAGCLFAVFHWITDTAAREHLLGQSERTEAQVVAVDRTGSCRRSDSYAYTMEWTEDGELRTEQTTSCGQRYDVGETVGIWSTSEQPYTESALVWRLFLSGVGMAALLLGWYLGRIALRVRHGVDSVVSGEAPATALPTTGDPADNKLQVVVEDDTGGRHRTVRLGRSIHMARRPGSVPAPPSATQTGTLSATLVRGSKPRGIALYEGDDGLRLWRFLG